MNIKHNYFKNNKQYLIIREYNNNINNNNINNSYNNNINNNVHL